MPKGESQDKFECRQCGCKQSTIRNTQVIEREWKGKKVIIVKRHRVCRFCKLPYTTNEYQYEDAVNHKIPRDSAMRPAYEVGRAIGAMEFINGITAPNQELTEPEQTGLAAQQTPDPIRQRGGARKFTSHLSPQKTPPPKKKR